MRGIILATLFLITSTPALACQLGIPESEAIKAINLEPNAGSKSCADSPEEKCVCYEGKDWATSDLVDGELVYNSDKAFAKERKEQSEKDAVKLAEQKKIDAIKAVKDSAPLEDAKGSTVAALRAEVNELIKVVEQLRALIKEGSK